MPRELDALPGWARGTVAVLATVGDEGEPHAIPVSAAVAAGRRRAVLALALDRESLARLKARPRVALCVLAAGDVAFTAHGSARVVEEPLHEAEGVAAVALEVESVRDHRQPTFVIEAGVRWRWTDPGARGRDERVHRALARLAAAAQEAERG